MTTTLTVAPETLLVVFVLGILFGVITFEAMVGLMKMAVDGVRYLWKWFSKPKADYEP